MSGLAQPSEAVECLVPYVYSGGEDGGAEVVELEAARDQGVTGSKEDSASGSGQVAVSGAYAHMTVEAVRLAVLCRRS